jgi:sugar transferase (PEP-CTERM/EpsH1 system associated)
MREPIRVMHVLFRFGIGGLENGLVNLVNGLEEGAYRHVIVALSDYDPVFTERLRPTNVELHALAKRPGNDPRTWWRLWRLLGEARPHVLHTRNFAALELQVPGWLAQVPGRVHGEHGWDVQDLDGSVRRYRVARRAIGTLVHRFIALSRDLERYLVERVGIPRGRVLQIYNGVDCQHFAPAAPRADAPVVIGTVGRMKAVKNQTLLCHAFAALVARRPDLAGRVHLRLVGSGPLADECAAVLAAAGLTAASELRGESSTVADELRAMDVFVLPSLAEGISNTILEAMASGLPVVATAVGGNAELVVDGETGALVPSGDVAAMARALERYVDDPALRRRHGQAARARAESHFSLERMLGAYDDVYRALAAA